MGVEKIEQLMDFELGSADAIMTDSLTHLFKAGGKRFRPLFTVLSAQIGPKSNADEVAIAGAVIELVHLATLYHDDVMDEGPGAPGRPTAISAGATTSRSWPATTCLRRRRGSCHGWGRTRCG